MEAEERKNAREEKREAKEKAWREGKDEPARTPGWPRSFYAGSTCMDKTQWYGCSYRWDGSALWGRRRRLIRSWLRTTYSYSTMIHYKYYLIRRVARRLKGLAKGGPQGGGTRGGNNRPLTVEALMRQDGWCVYCRRADDGVR